MGFINRRRDRKPSTVAAWLVASAVSAILAVGCSAAPPPTPEQDDVSKQDYGFSCGDYPAKQCDPQNVVDFIWADVDDAVSATGDCVSCTGTLVAVGAVTVTGCGIPMVLSGGLVWDTIMFASDCQQCVEYAEESGMLEVLSCTLQPCEYSEEARQKECELMCGDQGLYGYVPSLGYDCVCTGNPFEAQCRAGCYSGYQVNESCGCDPIPVVEEPPPPECSDSGDGWSCSPDPESGMDRACCQGQCVIWECSACDDNPYCY